MNKKGFNFLRRKPEAEYVAYEREESAVAEQESEVVDYMDSEKEYQEGKYLKLVRFLVMVGVFLTPLFFLPWTTGILEVNKQALLVAVAGLGLILWLLEVVMSGRLSWRFNPLDKGVAGLLLAVLLATIFSISKFKSVFGVGENLSDSFLTISALTVLYFLIVNSFDDGGRLLKKIFIVSLVVALLYGLLQMFGIYIFKYLGLDIFKFTQFRAFNTLGSINVTGIMAAIGLPLFYKSRISIFRNFDISKLGLLAALTILIIINWWVLWTVAIVGMVALVALESLRQSSRRESSTETENPIGNFKISRFLMPTIVIVLGVFLVIVNFNFVFIKNHLPIELASSFELSGHVAQGVLKNNFLFGYGPENFSVAFDKYGASALRNTTVSNVKFFDATSQVLNIVTSYGLVGIAALAFLIWILTRTVGKNASEGSINFDSGFVGVTSALAASLATIFLYPFNTVLAFTFYLLLGLLVLAVWGDRKKTYNIEEKATLSLISSLGFIGVLIFSLVAFYFAGLNYAADKSYAKALTLNEPQRAIDYVARSVKWKGNDDRFYRLASRAQIALLVDELDGPPKKGDDQRNTRLQNYVSSSVALARKAVEIDPEESNNWTNLGNVYQNLTTLVEGSDSLAEAAYKKASELRPGDPFFYNQIGNMYLAKADLFMGLAVRGGNSASALRQQAGAVLVKAEENFKQAIELSNNFGLAIYNLGAVYDRQGKVEEAIKQLERLVPFNNNQAGLAFELGLLYYRSNQKDKAFGQLQRAVVLFPDYANARWYLALIYEERQDIQQAINQLESILNIEANQNNQIVEKKLSELKVGNVSIPPGKVLDQKPL